MGVDAGLDAIDLVIDASMRPQSSADDHWVTGDHFGLPIRQCGGPDLNVDDLHNQVMLYVGIMAVAWLLDVPALIRSRFGEAARTLSRKDPRIKEDESVRAPLQMLTNALNLWETRHFGDLLDAALA